MRLSTKFFAGDTIQAIPSRDAALARAAHDRHCGDFVRRPKSARVGLRSGRSSYAALIISNIRESNCHRPTALLPHNYLLPVSDRSRPVRPSSRFMAAHGVPGPPGTALVLSADGISEPSDQESAGPAHHRASPPAKRGLGGISYGAEKSRKSHPRPPPPRGD